MSDSASFGIVVGWTLVSMCCCVGVGHVKSYVVGQSSQTFNGSNQRHCTNFSWCVVCIVMWNNVHTVNILITVKFQGDNCYLSPQRTVVRGHCWHGAASNLVGECRVIGLG